ncbi:MAG: endonuclease [Alphaproteobacteria bacterium]|nr:MAG: endonuclease [Alphaproteobacteria bacterium]
MRFATWNIEWFDALFDEDSRLILDDGWSRRPDVTRQRQAEAIATVIRRVDPDLLLVVEAPDTSRRRSTIDALEGFAVHFGLRQRDCIIGFQNGTRQELALLTDPDICTARHDPQGVFSDGTTRMEGVPAFNGRFRWDIDADGRSEPHEFSKPPLEAEITLTGSGARLRLIGVHAKSKAAHGARNRDHARRIAIANRRKQLAQCFWLRLRIEEHLDRGDPLIVMGDLNDGPGLDEYEALFGRSGVEIVMGDPDDPARMLVDPNALSLIGPRRDPVPATARFYQPERRQFLNALLDYVMLSPDLAARTRPVWRIWHPFDDPECLGDPALFRALMDASDHYPVSVDFSL